MKTIIFHDSTNLIYYSETWSWSLTLLHKSVYSPRTSLSPEEHEEISNLLAVKFCSLQDPSLCWSVNKGLYVSRSWTWFCCETRVATPPCNLSVLGTHAHSSESLPLPRALSFPSHIFSPVLLLSPNDYPSSLVSATYLSQQFGIQSPPPQVNSSISTCWWVGIVLVIENDHRFRQVEITS